MASDSGYNPRVLSVLLSAAVVACVAHPVELDVEVTRRAVPWLPPDLARQVVRHQREVARGARAAASWPRPYHQLEGREGIEASIEAQCRRLVAAIRGRTPFGEVVAGLGALAHSVVDLNHPFVGGPGAALHAESFATYMRSAQPRIPLVYYGLDTGFLDTPLQRMTTVLHARRANIEPLASIIVEDLDRIGGPAAWPQLDDRSSTFGAASIVINHASTDFANLASWIWRRAGGLVPEINVPENSIMVWKGAPQPREAPRARLGFRQTWP